MIYWPKWLALQIWVSPSLHIYREINSVMPPKKLKTISVKVESKIVQELVDEESKDNGSKKEVQADPVSSRQYIGGFIQFFSTPKGKW